MKLYPQLEEVNAYLETQARARERLDHMRDSNETELRRDFEKTKRELLVSGTGVNRHGIVQILIGPELSAGHSWVYSG